MQPPLQCLPVHLEGACRRGAPGEALGASEAELRELVPAAERLAHAVAEALLVRIDDRVASDLEQRGLTDADDRRSACHRLHDRQAEPFVPRRLQQACGPAVEICEPPDGDVALEPGAFELQLTSERRIPDGTGDDERKA